MLTMSCAQDRAPQDYYLRINDQSTRADFEKSAKELMRLYQVSLDYSATQFDSDGLIQYLDVYIAGPDGEGGKAQGDREGLGLHDFGWKIERDAEGDVIMTNLFLLENGE